MKPYKILYVTRHVDGGVGTVIERLVNGLDKTRYEPIVLFETARKSRFRERLHNSEIKTIELQKCSGESAPPPLPLSKNRKIGSKFEELFGKKASQYYFALRALWFFLRQDISRISLFVRTIKENGISLVHTHHDLRRCKPEIVAARIAGIPCVSHRHGYANYTPFDMLFARFVNANLYISNSVAAHHISQGESAQKGHIIHNGINISEFAKSYDTASIRKNFDCQQGERMVGIIGRIDWWKGHEYFLEAIAGVAPHIPGIKGLIIGDLTDVSLRNQQYNRKLHGMVSSLGLAEKIVFTGFRTDIPEIISALDMVVHASSEPEPFGLVVIEGMAAGKPVVATAAGGILDIIENGVSGLLIPCKDSKAMARAIVSILSDEKKMKLMGTAARQRITEKFTIQQQVENVQKVYEFLLNTAMS
jgi:glycosyltransferase involved in cell wall biosynthesis